MSDRQLFWALAAIMLFTFGCVVGLNWMSLRDARAAHEAILRMKLALHGEARQ